MPRCERGRSQAKERGEGKVLIKTNKQTNKPSVPPLTPSGLQVLRAFFCGRPWVPPGPRSCLQPRSPVTSLFISLSSAHPLKELPFFCRPLVEQPLTVAQQHGSPLLAQGCLRENNSHGISIKGSLLFGRALKRLFCHLPASTHGE